MTHRVQWLEESDRTAPWWRTSPAVLILGLLLVTDLAFALGSFSYDLGLLKDDRLSLGAERGLPETWGYVQFLWSLLALGVLFRRRRDAMYVVLAVIVAYLLVDDGLTVHEEVGAWLSDAGWTSSVLGVDANHVGEVLFSLGSAVVLLAGVAIAWRWASRPARRVAMGVLGCVAVMAFAGIAVDFLQSMIARGNPIFVFLEDGGELVAGTVMTAFLMTAALLGDEPPLVWRTRPGRDAGPAEPVPEDSTIRLPDLIGTTDGDTQ